MNIVKRIDKDTEKEIRTSFLEKLGVRIRINREKQNISQESLGKCLGLSPSSISRIENGVTDTPVSNLQLISLYCKFPLDSLFCKDESKAFLDAFSSAVEVTAKKYTRTKKKAVKTSKKRLSDEEMYKQGLVEVSEEPVSPSEFYAYFVDDKEIVRNVISAGELLNNVKNKPDRSIIADTIAEFVIDEIGIINTNSNNNNNKRHLYAYYKALYDHYKASCNADEINVI